MRERKKGREGIEGEGEGGDSNFYYDKRITVLGRGKQDRSRQCQYNQSIDNFFFFLQIKRERSGRAFAASSAGDFLRHAWGPLEPLYFIRALCLRESKWFQMFVFYHLQSVSLCQCTLLSAYGSDNATHILYLLGVNVLVFYDKVSREIIQFGIHFIHITDNSCKVPQNTSDRGSKGGRDFSYMEKEENRAF